MGASVADYEYDCCEATATSLAATHLAGFNGELMPFTLCTLPDAETDRLPTSSTCFNKVYLPRYFWSTRLNQSLGTRYNQSLGTRLKQSLGMGTRYNQSLGNGLNQSLGC